LDQHDITIYDNIHRNALKFTSFANRSRLTFVQGLALDLNALTQAMATAKVFSMPQSTQEAIALTERQPTMKVTILGAYNELETADQRALAGC